MCFQAGESNQLINPPQAFQIIATEKNSKTQQQIRTLFFIHLFQFWSRVAFWKWSKKKNYEETRVRFADRKTALKGHKVTKWSYITVMCERQA